MQVRVEFKHIQKNKNLESDVKHKIARIEKFEIKPSHTKVVFSAKHHECCVEIDVKSANFYARATALAEDHLTAFEWALEKIEKQLMRHKSQVQLHKHKTMPHETHLNGLRNSFDAHNSRMRARKGSRAG